MTIGFYDLEEKEVVGQEIRGQFIVSGRLKKVFDTIEKSNKIISPAGISKGKEHIEIRHSTLLSSNKAPMLLLDSLRYVGIVPYRE